MAGNSPTLDAWRRLYEAMNRIKEMAPWEWMEETDIFGVQSQEGDEPGFVSVMGMAGEHFAVAVYLGARGLYGFWDLQDLGPSISPETMLEVPQLQASFENRDYLQKEDRQVINDLGLKFRGQQAWPMFRSYRPGFYPWFLEAEEARLLIDALEQTLDVAPRLKGNPSLLVPPGDETYFVRAMGRKGDWEDRAVQVPMPEPPTLAMQMDMEALDELNGLPLSQYGVEVDFFMMPTPVQERKDDRPAFPYLLLVVGEDDYVLGSEMLIPSPTLEAMWEQIPMTLVQQLAQAGVLPQNVRVRSDLLLQLIRPLADELSFYLKQSKRLPHLDAAREFMSGYMGR